MTRAALLPAAVLLAMAPGAAGMAGARKSWDFGRFINTAATFNSPADALARAFGGSTSPKQFARGQMVWSPEVTNGFEFAALDDVVMGGCSQSTVRVKTDGLQWSGETTTANNGGFTGVRTKTLVQPLDISACKGITLRVKADGFRYKCILRDSSEWNGVAWTASFDTPANGRPYEVKLPFKFFVPTMFAKTIRTEALKTDAIVAFQLSLSKFEYDGGLNPTFQEGPFALTLLDISTF